MVAIMKSLCFVFIVLASVATLFSVADANKFNVGGDGAWVVTPHESYNAWAASRRFQVNDTLYFKYAKESDSVQQVTNVDYDACNVKNPIEKFDDGETEVALNRSGPFYFISGNQEHCSKGQKLVVFVLGNKNHQPKVPVAPSPAQPPKAHSPVSPVAPAKPPSMTQPPKAHSPVSPAKPPSMTQPPHAHSPVSPAKPPAMTQPPHAHSPVSPAKAPTPSPATHLQPSPSNAPKSPPSPKSPSPAAPPKSPPATPADASPSPSKSTPPPPADDNMAPAPSPKSAATVVTVTSVMSTLFGVAAFTVLMFA